VRGDPYLNSATVLFDIAKFMCIKVLQNC